MWTKGRTLQNLCVWDVLLAKLTAKKIAQNVFHKNFLLKTGEHEGTREGHSNKGLLQLNTKHLTQNYQQDESLLKKKIFLISWLPAGSVIIPFLLLYMNCYGNSYIQGRSWCVNYSVIGQQLLQKASALMTGGKCNGVHNLKCCLSLVLEGEELKRWVLLVDIFISLLGLAKQEMLMLVLRIRFSCSSHITDIKDWERMKVFQMH